MDIEHCRRLDSKLTIGLKSRSLPWFHSESLYSNFLTVNYISPENISDISRIRPIRLLTLNHFSFVMTLIAMFVMFVIATFSGLTGSGLYAKGRNISQHSWCISSMFVLLRRIASLFMIYYLGVCTVYAQTEDDGPKPSAVTAYQITTDDVTRANIANVTEPCRCTTTMMILTIGLID
jgi:hypothetical protein